MMADGYYKVQGKNGPSNWDSLEASAKEAKLGYTLVSSTDVQPVRSVQRIRARADQLEPSDWHQVDKANKEITDAQ